MFKCENCGVKKNFGDEAYFVATDIPNWWLTTCSKKCAEELKQKEIEKLQNAIKRIERREIFKEEW